MTCIHDQPGLLAIVVLFLYLPRRARCRSLHVIVAGSAPGAPATQRSDLKGHSRLACARALAVSPPQSSWSSLLPPGLRAQAQSRGVAGTVAIALSCRVSLRVNASISARRVRASAAMFSRNARSSARVHLEVPRPDCRRLVRDVIVMRSARASICRSMRPR